MSSKRPYLLDSSFCIALLRDKPAATRWLQGHDLTEMAVSAVTEMELWLGVAQSGANQNEGARVSLLLRAVRVRPWDSAAARVTAEKYHLLAQRGGVIEAADMFIAGHAISLGHTLVTADRHLLTRADALGLFTEDYRLGPS